MSKRAGKMIRISIITVAAVAIVAAAVLYTFILGPQRGIDSNRSTLPVTPIPDDHMVGDCVHFLNTGSSDAILLQSDGHFALIDCAEDSDNPRGFDELEYRGYEQDILSYLKQYAVADDGMVHLDFVLGTHAHSDHIGGFDTVIGDDSVIVDRAYLKRYDESRINPHEVECWDNKEVYDQMVAALTADNVPIISDISDTDLTLGNFDIRLFNTEYDTLNAPVGENDNSIGVLVSKAGRRIFLAGDIDNHTGDEDRLAPAIGRVDVLKVGHHSYSGSTTSTWLRRLAPSVCVVTNTYDSADKRTLRRITRVRRAPILLTGSENGVVISISDDGELSYYNHIQPLD